MIHAHRIVTLQGQLNLMQVGRQVEAILHNTPVPVRELNSELPTKLVTTTCFRAPSQR
jgi:hypothetical protein